MKKLRLKNAQQILKNILKHDKKEKMNTRKKRD